MAEVIFNYNGKDTIIQCRIEDKLKDICLKFAIKVQIDINKIIFIYGGRMIDLELKYKELVNEIDEENLKMKILVYDNDSNIINDRIIKAKDIICPKCGEICLINFKEYKVILENCKNKHENRIRLKEYENSQNINENKIICNICKENNKSNSYNKIKNI